METINLFSYEEMAQRFADMYDRAENRDIECLIIVNGYSDARKLLGELAYVGFDISMAALTPEYDDEYYINLTVGECSCLYALGIDDYIYNDADFVYISNDCNSKIIKSIDYHVDIFAFDIGEEAIIQNFKDKERALIDEFIEDAFLNSIDFLDDVGF